MGAGAGPPGCACLWGAPGAVQGEGRSSSSIRNDGVGDRGDHLMTKPQLTRQCHFLQPLHTIPSPPDFPTPSTPDF